MGFGFRSYINDRYGTASISRVNGRRTGSYLFSILATECQRIDLYTNGFNKFFKFIGLNNTERINYEVLHTATFVIQISIFFTLFMDGANILEIFYLKLIQFKH
eukprot:341533_1